ncbi:ammonia-dependent NAD(+) synthetase [Brevibacterium samyangense]|uniref:NH(3)-dependent NAD(+) synthetase n=1 Tax=Brevibacterium samyangense TaxID=366888 RepID=A0ABN2TI79_9MICO
MSAISEQIRNALGVVPEIDPEAEVQRRVQFLVEYCLTAGAAGFVLGISGGQDSTLAGRLGQLAAEKLRAKGHDASFVAVRLPYKVQKDEEDAQCALDFIRPDESLVFNIAGGTDGMSADFFDATGAPISDFNKGNVKARMRMIAQYTIAGERRMLVIGTDHAAEAITGFFTKFGDGGADVLPLSGLTKGQGKQLLRHLGGPEEIVTKAPTADLLDDAPGQTDESSLGLTYEQLDAYLVGEEVPDEIAQKIESRYLSTEHKRRLPVTPLDSWWIRQ